MPTAPVPKNPKPIRDSNDRIRDRHSRDRSRVAKEAISAWKTQAKDEREMRKLFAGLLLGALFVQIVLVNVAFFLIGFGCFVVDEWTARVFIVATYSELAAMVFFIVRYLFSRDDQSLSQIAEILRIDAEGINSDD